MILFHLAAVTLANGEVSDFKIECDALKDSDIKCLCYLLADRLPAFGAVEGVPRGGLRIAREMEQYATSGPLLIVDDVFTTGTSIRRYRPTIGMDGSIAGVFFARNPPPEWLTTVFQLAVPRGFEPRQAVP